jgi:hypothetical protein
MRILYQKSPTMEAKETYCKGKRDFEVTKETYQQT